MDILIQFVQGMVLLGVGVGSLALAITIYLRETRPPSNVILNALAAVGELSSLMILICFGIMGLGAGAIRMSAASLQLFKLLGL